MKSEKKKTAPELVEVQVSEVFHPIISNVVGLLEETFWELVDKKVEEITLEEFLEIHNMDESDLYDHLEVDEDYCFKNRYDLEEYCKNECTELITTANQNYRRIDCIELINKIAQNDGWEHVYKLLNTQI